MSGFAERMMAQIAARNPGQPEFHQAVMDVAASVRPFLERHPEYERAGIFERLIEPERVIIFRVPWLDDAGQVRVNRGYRLEFSSALGPYFGGLRFHPSVNLSILKFLGFDQVIRNALTGLPLGGGRGGSDFDPKGKSDAEIMRFCQSFMTEMFRFLGPSRDVVAGDIGVGSREIGYLFGQYKRLVNSFEPSLVGEGSAWGGGTIQAEIAGYACVYFAEEMLRTRGESIAGKRVAVSGSGKVALAAASKAASLGGVVVTLSDSRGFIVDVDGISGEKLEYVRELKMERRVSLREYLREFSGATWHEGLGLWSEQVEVALPCATQNELDYEDATTLLRNGCKCVCEGAAMPTTRRGVEALVSSDVLFGPSKASGAGAVALVGLEIGRRGVSAVGSDEQWDQRLQQVTQDIHSNCLKHAATYGHPGDYLAGANIVGFANVADAMMSQGIV